MQRESSEFGNYQTLLKDKQACKHIHTDICVKTVDKYKIKHENVQKKHSCYFSTFLTFWGIFVVFLPDLR